MRYRHLGLVITWLALGSAPCISSAQGDPAKTADPKVMMATMGRVFSSPEISPSLPVTPERLALVHQCLAEANGLAALDAFSAFGYSQAEAEMTATTKGLPKSRQALVMAAFATSFKAAEVKLKARIVDGMESYYAARMTDGEIKAVIDFYGSGLGYKMMHDGQSLSAEERQHFGIYVFSNPAMTKFVKLNFDYMKGAQARRQASQAIFTADFNAGFCQALASEHLKMSTCPGPPSSGMSR